MNGCQAVVRHKVLVNPQHIRCYLNPTAVAAEKIHYNPKFLSQRPESVHINPKFTTGKNPIHVNKNFLKQPPPVSPKLGSKYKFISQTVTAPTVKSNQKLKVKSKYSIRTCPVDPAVTRERSDFKTLSRTKLVRKSLLRKQTPNSKRKYKLVNSPRRGLDCSFRSTCSNKLVRKSILSQVIEARRKRSVLLKNSRVAPSYGGNFKKRLSLKLKSPKFNGKLKKTNQKCLFYNRFGRCKGKERGTCHKIHDPLYVSVCRKLLLGGCNDKDCLLSHDIQPGKMPTCHHYLAGSCSRKDCPFLHIKVNKKAPVCTAFLQGFCPDVFNCMKKHEFVCPVFSEKGFCRRGKSCVYPHKSSLTVSKLLQSNHTPLIPSPPQAASKAPRSKTIPKKDKRTEETAFKRYFTAPLTSKESMNES